MLLNRLELQGFKSFPDKINLDFNHRITAVVGPNGSGKSNITDSIRWLLGERDARNLRGGKGEDLIFAGTESRPRVGLAQATIYFNNSSNSFPLDFKEVSISRRISRDGTSQFFINKAEVRLKDLVDILAKAKLGARGLTVINQGADDVFIKASPLERRTMIEETLGLKEYQIKKSDAVRRLQTTAFNLEKVKALIEELKPHLRSLKRQVSRYEGREELAHELRQLENNFYGGRLTKLREELSGLSKQESKLKEAIHKQELALKKVEEEFNGVSLSEPQSVKELKEVQIEREKLLIGRREIEKTAAKLEAQLEFEEKNPDSDPNNVRKAVEEIRELVKSLLEENELSLLKAGIKQVSELVEGLFKFRKVEKSPDLEKNFKKLTADLNSLDKELEALNKKENNRRQLLEGFNQNFRRAYESVERERKEFEKLREEGSRILLAKERADTRLIDLREELSQIGLSVEKLEKASM
ncbi:MAG: AAA family ATPase, partial [Candidatus Colwellbacteria bacterium]|nr:AAA family ATPase [Candidatus Colwellbacteria bacterium]